MVVIFPIYHRYPVICNPLKWFIYIRTLNNQGPLFSLLTCAHVPFKTSKSRLPESRCRICWRSNTQEASKVESHGFRHDSLAMAYEWLAPRKILDFAYVLGNLSLKILGNSGLMKDADLTKGFMYHKYLFGAWNSSKHEPTTLNLLSFCRM